MLGIFIVLFVTIGQVVSHSWLACVDYTEKNGAVWDADKCRGFARDSYHYAKKNEFGNDRGFDHKPGSSGNPCKTRYGASSYVEEYPQAIYYPGQQIVLVHPMKNHGAASCTNIYIPDFGSNIYRGLVNTDTDKPYSYYKDKLVSSLGTSIFGKELTNPDQYPKPGYQNAPNFCDNTDKAMATYSFNVPDDLSPGRYTFVWSWNFNGPTDTYTSCFDVQVTSDKTQRDQILQLRDSNVDLSVTCGGVTSDNSAGSEVGCSGQVIPPTPPPTTKPAPTTKSTTAKPKTTTKSAVTTTKYYPTPTVSTHKPTNPPATTKSTSTESTDEDDDGSNDFCLPVFGHQFTGSIDLGIPPSAIKRRYVVIDFYCDVESVSIWSGTISHELNGRKYEIMQDKPNDVIRGKIDFFVS